MPEAGIEEMKFTFYGNSIDKTTPSQVYLDNLAVYEDYFIKALEIESDKTIFVKGEELSGLKVKAIYADNTCELLDEYRISGYDALTLGEQTVTVSYGMVSAEIKVEVVEDTEKRIVSQMNDGILSAAVKNNTEAALIIAAEYDENGRITSVMTKSIKADETVEFAGVEDTYKIFAWNSIKEMEPVIK